MHCARFDHIPPFFSPALVTTATRLKHFEAERKRASLCNKAAASPHETSSLLSDFRYRKWKQRWVAEKIPLSVKQAWENWRCKSTSFSLCWKDNTMKVGQRRCRRRLGQQMCVSMLRSVWERERGRFRPFQNSAVSSPSIGKLPRSIIDPQICFQLSVVSTTQLVTGWVAF